MPRSPQDQPGGVGRYSRSAIALPLANRLVVGLAGALLAAFAAAACLGLLVLGALAIHPPDDTVGGAGGQDAGVIAVALVALVAGAFVDMMIMALAAWLLILATRQRRLRRLTAIYSGIVGVLAATGAYAAVLFA